MRKNIISSGEKMTRLRDSSLIVTSHNISFISHVSVFSFLLRIQTEKLIPCSGKSPSQWTSVAATRTSVWGQ